jgi:hypothetical protein
MVAGVHVKGVPELCARAAQVTRRTGPRARPRAGARIDNRTAITAITTSSSISENAFLLSIYDVSSATNGSMSNTLTTPS